MKKYILPIMVLIIIIVILGISFISFKEEESKHNSSVKDIVDTVTIDDVTLDLKFIGGNIVDDKVSYGNKITKIIEITNNTESDVAFALAFKEVLVSDKLLNYNLYYSYDFSTYNTIKEGINITSDENLAYNLVCAKNSKISFKIEFIGNNESSNTTINGKLSIISNLSEKDIFKTDVLDINSEILTKIKALNGINQSGYYIVNIDSLSESVQKDFKGYVLIDAQDYSDLVYYYFISNSKFMLDNYKLSNSDIDKKYIKDIDANVVDKYTFDTVCSTLTKKGCLDFSVLTYNPLGGKDNFYKSSMEVINLVKKDFTKNEKKVFIYDVTSDIENTTNIHGYILIDNTQENAEYYIYLTNDIYMISGYNLTKLGEYKRDSSTIRAYNTSSFNLSSENEAKVCSFSGFSECYKISGDLV